MERTYLDINNIELSVQGGVHTASEIHNQPDLWRTIIEDFQKNQAKIRAFLTNVLDKENLQIVLTGAGSSAFIGQAVEYRFRASFGKNIRAIPTTTLVTHFDQCIRTDHPLLLISFARSGNSPESIAAVELAELFCADCSHIAINCNQSGNLAALIDRLPNAINIILPPESEDKALAMTGSFTSMMLVALALANINRFDELSAIINTVSKTASAILKQDLSTLNEFAKLPFERIIFLGSAPLLAIAEESHLKVQELCDGRVVGKFDSFLGFRHGPKAIINSKTVVVCLFSGDDYVFQYEKDLARQLQNENEALAILGIFPDSEKSGELPLNHQLVLNNYPEQNRIGFEVLPYVVPAQILGFYKSLHLGLQPDTPSQKGSITRIVEGVTIYPFEFQD